MWTPTELLALQQALRSLWQGNSCWLWRKDLQATGPVLCGLKRHPDEEVCDITHWYGQFDDIYIDASKDSESN